MSFGTLGMALAVGGCTTTVPAPAQASIPGASSPDSTRSIWTAAEFVLPADLPAPSDVGAGETRIAELGSQRQGAVLGPLTLGGKTVVYLRCSGTGALTFDMQGVGRFPLPCEEDAQPRGIRSVFDTRLVQQATVTVDSGPGHIWSLGVYSEPIP